MRPELAFALFLVLLSAVTALWLGNRALRERRAHLSVAPDLASEPTQRSQFGTGWPESLVSQSSWFCRACGSLNRLEASLCHSCARARASAGHQLPAETAGTGMIPVMAADFARSRGEATRTALTLAAPWAYFPVPDLLVRDPEHRWTADPDEEPAGVSVCPFLGFRDDPSTRCDYPSARNVCHATWERGAATLTSPRRVVSGNAGGERSRPIGAEHQRSLCLTAAHEQCARYPAGRVVAANRSQSPGRR